MREGWEYKKLGDLCDIYQPKTLATEQLVADGKYYVYGANGIIGRYNDYNHEQSEILLTCRGATCGTINISQPYSWINGNAMVIHRKSEDLSFDFLKYLMLSLDYSLIITGAAQPQITRQKIAPILVKYPSLSVQQSIVSELDKINELIRLKKEQLKDYDNLAQSIFYEMFGDPAVNDKNWKVMKLGEICRNCDNLRKPITASDRIPGSIPYYGASGIVDYVEDYIFSSDYLLVSEDGANLLARTTPIAFSISGKTWVNNHAHVLEFKDSETQLYVEYLINSVDISNYITGAVQPKLNQAKLNVFPIPLPPHSLQQLFAQRIELIEQQKAEIQSTIADLETLLASRMQYWFD